MKSIELFVVFLMVGFRIPGFLFVNGMPSYKTKQVDEKGKAIYQDVCYPVTKEFREKLYNEIISEYEKAKEKNNEKAREDAKKQAESPDRDRKETPFR